MIKSKFNNLINEMSDLGRQTDECLSLLQLAFISISLEPLKECREKIAEIRKAETALAVKITDAAKQDPAMKQYILVPEHILRIAENIDSMAQMTANKIKENILFSERAITEGTFLLQRLKEIIMSANDLLFCENTILNSYVEESEANLVKTCIEYSTLHEERLIEGLCQPISSSIYIAMLDCIRNIAWHAKEIAIKANA
jgi:Na+/phosphate symporter